MRPASRSPPFLLIGLLVALCILAFNYWNLSGKNGALSRQLEAVQLDFRAVSDKHLTLEKRAADLATQVSTKAEAIVKFEKEKSDKDAKIQELTGNVEKITKEKETETNRAVKYNLYKIN